MSQKSYWQRIFLGGLVLWLGLGCLSAQHIERTYIKPEVDPARRVKPAVYPPSWWTGMQMDTVQFMLHGTRVSKGEIRQETEGIEILSIEQVENPNYAFVTAVIHDTVTAGDHPFTVRVEDMVFLYPFSILGVKSHQPQGLESTDLIYLLMPDRFSNGEPGNDRVGGMLDQSLDRSDVFKRHGGDLKGIIDRVAYLKNLGVGALWLNPVQENDQQYESYHGYAITDHYSIDPRLGSNEDYQRLADSLHQKGMNLIMDAVFNHCGSQHFFIQDYPEKGWVHEFDEFTKTNYRHSMHMDAYASKEDSTQYANGWFDIHMPDLNQENPRVAQFLIQNAIWWVEFAGLDGYRVDTYPYTSLAFSNRLNDLLEREYPELMVFGEVWAHGIPIQAYFTHQQDGSHSGSNLTSVTDFELYYALNEAMTNPDGWKSGINRVYLTLGQDYMYEHPERNIIFLDNHDLTRLASVVEGGSKEWIRGITLLMTLRGIPMINYGTEILMDGSGGTFGEGGRKDFPGGWASDTISKFETEGRTEAEEQAFQLIRRLAHLRKDAPDLVNGRLVHFLPQNGVYVYFKMGEEQRFCVIVNTSDKTHEFKPDRYAECGPIRMAFDHISLSAKDARELIIEPGQTLLLELE